ncbi:MAG: xylulokinase, partial [Clostridiales bacterium]|nr:xylulokinase [Clostridiales bacterium]
IWCDQRTVEECEEITSIIGRERLVEITANPALTGFTASKIRWVYNHEPQIYEKIYKILLPKDYIRYKLTGEFATEVSDASGMQLLNIGKRSWSGEMLSKLEVSPDWLGTLYESPELTGKISREASELCGLAEGVPVAGGAGDQAAGAVGNGIVREGVVSSTIGTSGVVFAHTDSLTIDPKGRLQTFCHAVPGTWHVMGCSQTSGLSLQWMRNNFCIEELRTAALMQIDPYELICAEAATSPIGSNGLLFLPYLLGERTPHLDPDARGVFFGISATHTKADMIRAVMEGVTYSLCDSLDLIRDLGVSPCEVRASGGGGKSALWRQMQSNVFGLNVTTVQSGEGPALGVALLAGVCAGVYGSVTEACDTVIRTKKTHKPDEKAHEIYEKYHMLFSRLYNALKEEYKILKIIK